jgi:hypothetical protein
VVFRLEELESKRFVIFQLEIMMSVSEEFRISGTHHDEQKGRRR